MAKNPQTLGQRVMQRRLELEMSKSELARRVTALGRKCAIQNIRHIENDEVENVTFFGTLAEALETNAYWLETGRLPRNVSDLGQYRR